MVGPAGAEKECSVYRGLLCHHSKYFDRLLNGGFKEAGSDTLRLTDVDTGAFKTFFYWLNSGHIDCFDDSELDVEETWDKAVNAYIFADFHQVRYLKNAILDELYFYTEKWKRQSTVVSTLAYSHTTPGDPLRNLFVDMSSQACRLNALVEDGPDMYDKQFLFDMVVALKNQTTAPGAPKFNRKLYQANMRASFCERYHHHGEDGDREMTDSS